MNQLVAFNPNMGSDIQEIENFDNCLRKLSVWKGVLLTSLHRIPCKHAFFCWNSDRRASKHAF